MAMPAGEVKQLVKSRGWNFVDLAARWGVSVTWMSRLVNQPHNRPQMYDDAFRGLPQRDIVQVQREPRHVRKRKERPRAWSPAEMFPVGRLFESIDNKVVEEGTRLVVRGVGQGAEVMIRFAMTDGDFAGEEFDVDMAAAQCHLADLGLDQGSDVQR